MCCSTRGSTSRWSLSFWCSCSPSSSLTPSTRTFVRSMVCAKTPNCSLNASSSTSLNQTDRCYLPSDVEQQVQAETSHWILYTNLAMGLPAILFSVFYGSISDQLGRKLFIFLPALGAAMNTGVILEVAYLKDYVPVVMCLIGAFSYGLYGGYSVLNSAVYSYTADVTAHSGRTRQIGWLESMTYLGATLSLLVSGVWMERDETLISIFWCVLVCYLAVMLYTVLALPESMYFSGHRSEDRRQRSTYNRKYSQSHKFSRACGRFLRAVRDNMCGFFKLLVTNWRVSLLMLVFFVVEVNFLGITDVVFLYSMGRPLCWKQQTIGYFLALKVFCNGLASMFLLPLLVALRLSDASIVLMGLVSGAAALVMMGLVTQTWIMFLVPAVGALRGCVVPCIRSMLSKQVPNDKQGILFSSVGVLESACTLIASVLYNSIYPRVRTIHHGFTFFMMAAALILPFLLILFFSLTRSVSCTCCHHGSRKKSKELGIEREPLLQ